MLRNSLAAAFLFLFVAAGQADTAQILGRWYVEQELNGIVFKTTMDIRDREMIVTNECTYNGNKATVSVTVKTSFTATTFSVTDDAEKKVTSEGLECRVSAEKTTMPWSVANDTLIWTMPDGAHFEMKRDR